MNPEYIRYVKTLASMQSMTKAAAALYISQPTLTKAITSLEQEYGVKLFDRSTKPIVITEAGQIFLKRGETILYQLTELEKEMHAYAEGHQFSLRIGTTSERGSVWIPVIMSAIRREMPNVYIEFFEDTNAGLEEKLLRGSLDIVLYCNGMSNADFQFHELGEDPILLITSKNHPLAQLTEGRVNDPYHPLLIPASHVENCDLLLLSEGHGMRNVAEQILYKHSIHCKPAIELHRHETVVRLVGEGFGIGFSSILTPMRLHMIDDLCYFTLDDPPYCRRLVAATEKNTGITEEMRQFIALVKRSVSENQFMCESRDSILVEHSD